MIECIEDNAEKFRDWIKNRGGVAKWESVNLSNPGASWSTPAQTAEGEPMGKPTWQAGNHPAEIVTDEKDVQVIVPKEVKRFHVGIRRGSQGFSFKLTDAASRRLRNAVEKARQRHIDGGVDDLQPNPAVQ